MHIVVTMTKYCEKLELQQHLQNFDLWDILCFYGRLCCLSINLLWGPDEYIVAKIPSKFHTNRTSIMAVMFSNRQEKGGFQFFEKKHWPSPELWISRMGQIFVFWKKSDASFGSSDASDFFSFLIFTFSILIHNSAQGWFDSNFHLNSFSAQNSFPFSPEDVWKLFVWWFLSQGLM